MINNEQLAAAVVKYKQAFVTGWCKKEKYKWNAIKYLS